MVKPAIGAALLLSTLLAAEPAYVRLKDIASLAGIRDNQLVGYGLVVGLKGTGDKRQTYFSAQSLANLLDRMGIQVNPNAMQVRNTAAVIVTATLPPFAESGHKVDIQVAAIGDATSLQGGLLVLTPLKAPDGRVFAVAQGPVITGAFSAGTGTGNSMTLNHPTAGRIPNGAIVEQAAPSVLPDQELKWQLNEADFTTAARMATAINVRFKNPLAKTLNAGSVAVEIPTEYSGRVVEFVSEMETLTLETDARQRIIVNERTGTIVLGKEVRIRPVSILHGNLSVDIQTSFEVSQPTPFGRGETTTIPKVGVAVQEEQARRVNLKEGATVEDLVAALVAIGSTPRDIISILQSLKASGALDAHLEVI